MHLVFSCIFPYIFSPCFSPRFSLFFLFLSRSALESCFVFQILEMQIQLLRLFLPWCVLFSRIVGRSCYFLETKGNHPWCCTLKLQTWIQFECRIFLIPSRSSYDEDLAFYLKRYIFFGRMKRSIHYPLLWVLHLDISSKPFGTLWIVAVSWAQEELSNMYEGHTNDHFLVSPTWRWRGLVFRSENQ